MQRDQYRLNYRMRTLLAVSYYTSVKSVIKSVSRRSPSSADPSQISHKTFGVRQLESLRLFCGIVCVILNVAMVIEHRLMKDRQTERRKAIVYTALALRNKTTECMYSVSSRYQRGIW